MVQQQFAWFCVTLLLWSSFCPDVRASQGPTEKPTLKEQVTMIPSGSVVEVKLKDKQKLVGRIGSVTDSGFQFERAGTDKSQAEVLAFQDVKSVKFKGSGPEALVSSVRGGKATLKEQLATIPPGSVVEVKLRKQPTVRGRLGALTDAGVEIQHTKNDRLLSQTFALGDVRSVRLLSQESHGMGLASKIVIGVLVGWAVVMLLVYGSALAGK